MKNGTTVVKRRRQNEKTQKRRRASKLGSREKGETREEHLKDIKTRNG